MEILLLGEVQVLAAGRRVDVGPSRRQAVLAALAVDAPHPVPVDLLVDRVWGENPPAGARSTLYAHVSRLRRLINADIIGRGVAGYALRVPRDAVDVHRVQRLVREAGDPATDDIVADRLAEAMDLWRGPPLAGVTGRWADEFRDHWQRRRLDVALSWGDAALRAGRAGAVLDVSSRLAIEHPLVEPLELLVMRALQADGRGLQALDRFAAFRRQLVTELGVEPGPALRAMQQELLGHGGETRSPRHRHHTREWGPFVGRVAELASARAAWARARTGDGPVVLVLGEAGVGKTRFADEVARVVTGDGGRVLWGACRESYAAAFQPVVEALSADAVVAELAGLPEAIREALGWVLPALRTTAPSGERDRATLFAAVSAALSALAAHGGLLLVIEDLHWATSPTLRLVEHVATTGGPAGLLVVITAREHTVDSTSEQAALLGRLRRLPLTGTVTLTGLNLAEVGTLATALRAGGRDPERLLRDTGGNPLLLGEVLTAAPGPPAAHRAVADVPSGVRDHIAARMAGLPDAVRQALEWAAVIGDDVELALLAAVLSTGQDQTLDLVEHAIAAGLLRELGAGEFAFVHALTRRALLEGRTATRLAMRRAHVADVLDRRPELAPHGRLARLASYRLAQVPPGAEGVAARSALAAAQHALTELAYEDAVALATAGRAVLVDADDLDLLVELWLVEAQATVRLSRHRQRLAAVRAAAALARRTGATVALARAAVIGTTVWTQGHLDLEMVQLAQEALDLLDGDHPALRAQLTAGLAGSVAIAGGSAAGWSGPPPLQLAGQALDLARAGDDLAALSGALVVRLVTLFGRPDLPEQLRLAEELVGLNESRGLRWRVPLRLMTGDRGGFESDLARLAELAALRHDNELQAYALQCQAMSALADCEFDRAGQLAMQASVVGQGHPDFVNAHLTQVFWIHFERGMLGTFETLAQGARDANQGLPVLQAMLAFIYAHLGRHHLARPLLAELARDEFAAVPRDITWQVALAGAADAAVIVGDRDAAASAARLLTPYSGQLIVGAGGAFCFGAVDRVLAMVAALCGDPTADQRFASAVALETGVSDALRLRTLWWRWHLLGPPPAAELDLAMAQARRLGLVDLARRLGRLRPALAGQVGSRPRSGGRAVLVGGGGRGGGDEEGGEVVADGGDGGSVPQQAGRQGGAELPVDALPDGLAEQ